MTSTSTQSLPSDHFPRDSFTVDSSSLDRLTYDFRRNLLEVVFCSGETFVYESVPDKLWSVLRDIILANEILKVKPGLRISIGSAFHWMIRAYRARYPFLKCTLKDYDSVKKQEEKKRLDAQVDKDAVKRRSEKAQQALRDLLTERNKS